MVSSDGEAARRAQRRAVNVHVYRMHGQAVVTGTTQQRLITHEEMHAQGEHGVPAHTHPDFEDVETYTEVSNAKRAKRSRKR